MLDDKKLIREALKGSQEAFEMIVRKYQVPLLNYFGRMINDRELTLDLTQEVFIKTYSALHTYDPVFKFSTWLFKIASNHLIDYWRKKKIETFSGDRPKENNKTAPLFQIPDGEPSVIKKMELSELRRRIEEALEKIPSSLRELFVWRHVNEFSYAEIAEIKGMPVGTVKNRVFQAKELIRKELEKNS